MFCANQGPCHCLLMLLDSSPAHQGGVRWHHLVTQHRPQCITSCKADWLLPPMESYLQSMAQEALHWPHVLKSQGYNVHCGCHQPWEAEAQPPRYPGPVEAGSHCWSTWPPRGHIPASCRGNCGCEDPPDAWLPALHPCTLWMCG